MAFQTVDQLLARFSALGATRVFCKHLSENDNSKQQIYVGGSFEALSFFPHGEITAHAALAEPNFKAPLDFYWFDDVSAERAHHAQLILYPKYPEVRLSGFLLGCTSAPAEHLQPKHRESRDGYDGRILVFGSTADNKLFAHLAPESSPLALALLDKFQSSGGSGLFLELTLPVGSDQNRARVLTRLRQIHEAGFHSSCRLDRLGNMIPYAAQNGGGYTLEALLGVSPNGNANPDYLGWEIKAYSQQRVTLMTPEPDGGYYGEHGVRAFVRRYGHDTLSGDRYFTGLHRAGHVCEKTGFILSVRGFNPAMPNQIDVGGAIQLLDANGNEAASWAFAQLLTHWNRKHAFAAYVPYTSRAAPPSYHYNSPVLMGEHTDFTRYLRALCSGAVVFDPGSKISVSGSGTSQVKARSQFRINVRDLHYLYETLAEEALHQ